jgi:hypothetical protein
MNYEVREKQPGRTLHKHRKHMKNTYITYKTEFIPQMILEIVVTY